MTTDGRSPTSLPSTRLCARRVDVAGEYESEADDEMLRAFLRGHRESLLAIVEGLDEEAWHRSVVPTGWTPAGCSTIWAAAPSGTGSKASWRASSSSCQATSARISRRTTP
jgi:Protein of unknown function (DUF664)